MSMALPTDINEYNGALEGAEEMQLCSMLAKFIAKNIPQAEGKVWHGHPVWFIEGNPLVGYSLKKSGIQLLFWSGQSFKTPGLKAEGKFQAAGHTFTIGSTIKDIPLSEWLQEAQTIQWNYKELPKRRELVKLTDFE